MIFHPDKCKVLNLGKHEIPAECYMTDIGINQKVKQYLCESEKDLGIWVDSDLSFKQHIAEKLKKANQNVGIIHHTFRYLDEETFVLSYWKMYNVELPDKFRAQRVYVMRNN